MKKKRSKIVITFGVTLGLLLAGFIAMRIRASLASRPDNLGIQSNGQLADCPDSPNCVCSSEERDSHSILPIEYASNDAVEAKNAMLTALENSSGAQVIDQQETYLYAEFTTPLMGFVDDVELLQDHDNKRFHVRSASRVGHSDLGANKKRVEQLRADFDAQMSQAKSDGGAD